MMEFKHTAVLLDEVIEWLNIKSSGIYVDGTLGGGGHAGEICTHLSEGGHFIGIDRDKDALNAATDKLQKYPCRKDYIQCNYSQIKSALNSLKIEQIDGAVLDLGVSSFQLDNPQRGFSYMQKAPLDMRMDAEDSLSAYDVINTYPERDLADIIKKYGEERWAARIASFLASARKDKPIEDTEELVNIIKAAIPASARRDGPHPAKRTFQAIRIEVNDELNQLKNAITEFCDVLSPGGRFAVISFHSLEDRIVKDIFAERSNPCKCPPSFPVCVCGKKADIKKVTGKPIVAGESELESNPRSRSAKLRVIEKL